MTCTCEKCNQKQVSDCLFVISYCFHEDIMTCTCEKWNQKQVIDYLFVKSYCFHENNMTCTCEKYNQKRVIDCLFVKVDVNLHIARQTQLFLKVNSLSSGTMAESCWGSSSEEELSLTQSTFTVTSDEYDGKYLLSVVAIPLVLRSCA